MIQRLLKTKMFFASTVEELDSQLENYLVSNPTCPGNYIDLKLTKLGNIYQLIFVFAVVSDK